MCHYYFISMSPQKKKYSLAIHKVNKEKQCNSLALSNKIMAVKGFGTTLICSLVLCSISYYSHDLHGSVQVQFWKCTGFFTVKYTIAAKYLDS